MTLHVSHPLVIATLATAAYTAVVWWICHPVVKAFVRSGRRRPHSPH